MHVFTKMAFAIAACVICLSNSRFLYAQLDLSNPQPLSVVNDSDAIWSPTVSPNGLELYYTFWYPDQPWDIYWASRSTVDERWKPEGPVVELQTDQNEGKTTLTPDGLTMIFATNQVGNWDLWTTSRESLDSPWGEPAAIESLSTTLSEGAPNLSADGLSLYFGAGWPGGSREQLRVVTRSSLDADWSDVDVVPGFEEVLGSNHPAIAPDGLTIVYAVGGGAEDNLWVATRETTDEPFGNHELLPKEFITPDVDSFPFIASDGSLYFVRGAVPGGAGWNIQKTGAELVSPFGDANNDVVVDTRDLDTICSAILRDRFSGSADLNEDGFNDQADMDLLVAQLDVVPGDTNGDRIVDFTDFLTLSDNFGFERRRWTGGDFDCNDQVDFTDFLALAANFSGNAGDTAASQAVPEPINVWWIPLAGLLLLRQRTNEGSTSDRPI